MGNSMAAGKRIQFVIKATKLCNLRCKYCYEYDHLGDPQKISSAQLRQLYRNIAPWFANQAPGTQLEFVWHGGEPLLLKPEYYWSTFRDQKEIFGDQVEIRNVVQTNLTKLDGERIALLRDGFDDVGVSLDVLGSLRVNLAGKDSVSVVLGNIDRLRKARIKFGAITVVSQRNARDIRRIVRFFHELNVTALRLLPLFDGAHEGQHAGFEISQDEMLVAMQEAFDELQKLDSGLRVEPLRRFARQVMHLHHGGTPRYFDKRDWETVLTVERDGSVYPYGDYTAEYCYGNLFESPLEECLASGGRENACHVAMERAHKACQGCRFHGSCSGASMAEEAGRRKQGGGELTCVIDRGMLEFVEQRMQRAGVLPQPGVAPRRISLPIAREPKQGAPIELPLQSNVRVFSAQGDPRDRITLSQGTTTGARSGDPRIPYLDVAVTPKGKFRALDDEEYAKLCPGGAPGRWEIGRDVGVIRIPDRLMAPFEGIFEDYGTRAELHSDPRQQDHSKHPAWDGAYRGLVDHLCDRYGLRDEAPVLARLASGQPRRLTVTKDRVQGRDGYHYVGLHLDTWERLPMSQRSQARNRICVNMGRQAREFLFINLTVAEMHRAVVSASGQPIDDYYGTDLGHMFMRQFPDYPVIKLRIAPREAYIAPTENLIHDGTSMSSRYPDIALHLLGYFGMAPGSTRVIGTLQTRQQVEFV